MQDPDRTIAVSFSTEREMSMVGQGLKLVYPVAHGTDLDDLIRAIDDADREPLSVRGRTEETARRSARSVRG